MEAEEVIILFEDYLSLLNLDKLMNTYRKLENHIYLFHYIFYPLKCEGIASKNAISHFADMAGKLTKLDEESLELCEQIGKLNSNKFELEKEV